MEKGSVIQEGDSKIAIIGAGHVGSTTAFALMLDGIVSEIALIDKDKNKAYGEALDLNHCMQFTRVTNVIAGDSFELVKGAKIIVICAGRAQEPGQKRTELLKDNTLIMRDIIAHIIKYNKNCILLVVTNPLDVMTYLAWKFSGIEYCYVFGTGTVLDSARLRYLVGKEYVVSPKDITAFVLGEHGDSEFVWWSGANIAGISLSKFSAYRPQLLTDIQEQTKNSAAEIIEKKGATYFAIALVIAKIVRSILLNQPRVFTVSSVLHNFYGLNDVALSMPTIIRKTGICERLNITLNENEKKDLEYSALKIKKNIDKALSYL